MTFDESTSADTPQLNHEAIVAATRDWVRQAVVGLNLCPFAKAVEVKDRIRYVVTEASEPETLCADLRRELLALHAGNPEDVETTLLIHPYALRDFLDYNDFLDIADALIEDLDLAGEIQIASFHPAYQFAGTAPQAIDNYTNRSPYPMLQLLRESSIEAAVDAYPDADRIYERNIETLRALGAEGMERLGVFGKPETPRPPTKSKK